MTCQLVKNLQDDFLGAADTVSHRIAEILTETEKNAVFTVRGREADGGFHDGQCRFVYRVKG